MLLISAFALVDDVSDVEPRFAGWVVGMRLACDSAAHLAGKTVAVKDKSAGLF